MEGKILTYEDAVAYLMDRLPMFQRVGSIAYKKDLTNTIALLEAMGNPHKDYKTVHVAGTNGKGSVSHMLAAFLEESGFKTGLYVSPHYIDIRERIKINGEYIDRNYFMSFVEKHVQIIEEIQPSYFELLVAMAFSYFSYKKVDIAVVEVGLGGRLDSTNVITPLLSVITNISYDHQNLLGDTLELIAGEKAGIIKQGVPVVIGERQEELLPVFQHKATHLAAELKVASDEWDFEIVDTQGQHPSIVIQEKQLGHKVEFLFPFIGDYHFKNTITAYASAQVLAAILGVNHWSKHFAQGIQKLTTHWKFMGRMQMLQQHPLVIADSAHNEAGLRYLRTAAEKLQFDHLHMVFGAVNDKDLTKVFAELPSHATYYFSCPNIPRGLPASMLREQALQAGLLGNAYSSVKEAYQSALKSAKAEDLILVAGSIFVVAEVLAIFDAT